MRNQTKIIDNHTKPNNNMRRNLLTLLLGGTGVAMTSHSNEPQAGSKNSGGFGSRLRRFGSSIVRNPYRTAQLVFFALIAIIVLQNLESTSIDVLFWSFAALPKLVLIFLSMVVGAAAWELVRRTKG
jgi:hypothetical protein